MKAIPLSFPFSSDAATQASFPSSSSSSSSSLLFCVLLTVCQQLTLRIEQLLGNKSTPYYMKAITCILAFRDQSVKVSTRRQRGQGGTARDQQLNNQ